MNHQQLEKGDEFEVVLIDDGSTDGTGEAVDYLLLTYPIQRLYLPRTENSCRSAARNAGIRAAKGELIVFVDGDQLVDPLFVQEHIRCHRAHPDVFVIGFRDYLAPGKVDVDLLQRSFTLDAFPPVSEPDERWEVAAALSENLPNLATGWHFLYGCNSSVRKQHLLDVGGFDENLRKWSFEDVELGYRLHRQGLTPVFNRYSRVYHQFHPESNRQRHADWRENFAYFTSKHPELEVRLQWVLDPYFDPDRADGPSWFEAYLRFEFACRALAGRLPLGRTYEVLVIDEERVTEAVHEIAQRGATDDLVVIDTTNDRDLPLAVQTLRTGRELLYFKQPDQHLLKQVEKTFGCVAPLDRATGA
ncbi:hypothetical protein GCM10022403_034770 [Streptomyces coacervatus]|uniref:Glycosyltransferase 2-like domain-containing protein n=1 Tax=Streptomyces coacervatus TaxID=647381 RepID=A0ABP7HMG4_9ACTN